MTVILSSNLFNYSTHSVQARMQQFRKDFQQLGQDLQAGNLSGQADFAALQNDSPQATSSSSSSNPIAQTIPQLSNELQSGNLTAQQDYSTLQQDFQNQASAMQRPHHHHRNHSGQDNGISQVLSQLGQDLQSGDVASAQKAYKTLQQDFEQDALANGAPDGVSATAENASV